MTAEKRVKTLVEASKLTAKKVRKKAPIKKKMGRPTKYQNDITVAKIYTYIDKMVFKDFYEYCGIECVCVYLGISKPTIYEWMKKYKDFLNAMKRWEVKRNKMFYMLTPQLYSSTWIFLAKNWLGMTDKQEIEHRGDEKLPIRIILTNDNPHDRNSNSRPGDGDKV